MSLIIQENWRIFTVQAYAGGEFETVTKADVLGKWSVFLSSLSCGFYFCVPHRTGRSG